MGRSIKSVLVIGLVVLVSALVAAPGEAQRRFPGRTRVVIGGYYRSPFFSPFYRSFYYSPFWFGAYYPWAAYDVGWYGPQWVGRVDTPRTVRIRTDVSPGDTQIYLDGYFAGTSSDFDGPFGRLRVAPGPHEIVLYLKGYRTVRRTLDVKAGADITISQKMVRLAPGEPGEPPPSPPEPPERAADEQRGVAQPEPPAAPTPPGRPQPPGAPQPPGPPDQPRRPAPWPPQAPVPPEARGFGAIAIRVQPAGADVLIDGDRWEGPAGAAPLVVQVAAGRHRIEVSKEGYLTYSTEIEVREGVTRPLNISLPVRQ